MGPTLPQRPLSQFNAVGDFSITQQYTGPFNINVHAGGTVTYNTGPNFYERSREVSRNSTAPETVNRSERPNSPATVPAEAFPAGAVPTVAAPSPVEPEIVVPPAKVVLRYWWQTFVGKLRRRSGRQHQ